MDDLPHRTVADQNTVVRVDCGMGNLVDPNGPRDLRRRQPAGPSVDVWIQADRNEGGRHQCIPAGIVDDPEPERNLAQNEAELADLRKGRSDRNRRFHGLAENAHGEQGRKRLDRDHHNKHRGDDHRDFDQAPRVKEHADRHEEEHGESVPHGQRVVGCPGREFGTADGQPGEKGAKRNRYAEDLGRTDGDSHGEDEHRKGEQLPRTGLCDTLQREGNDPLAQNDHDGNQPGDFQRGHAENGRDVLLHAPFRREDNGQEKQERNRQNVFHDGPSDRDVTDFCVQIVPLGQHERHHDRAGHGNGHSQDKPGRPVPSHQVQQKRERDGGQRALYQRTRYRDAPDGHQFAQVKTQPDAEEEENHADLGELLRDCVVRDDARGERSDNDSRQQVTDDGGELQTDRNISKNQGADQADGKCNEYAEFIHDRFLKNDKLAAISKPTRFARPAVRTRRPADISARPRRFR